MRESRLPALGCRRADLPDQLLGRARVRGLRPLVVRPRAVGRIMATRRADLDVTPYGTEAMHVLRAEKGYVIVGQETDGTVTASDLGLDWMLSEAQVVHRPPGARPRAPDPARSTPAGRPPAGRPRRVRARGQRAGRPTADSGTVGNVTSSYRSAALGRTFALGLLAGGRARIGGYGAGQDRTGRPCRCRSSSRCSGTRRTSAAMAEAVEPAPGTDRRARGARSATP